MAIPFYPPYFPASYLTAYPASSDTPGTPTYTFTGNFSFPLNRVRQAIADMGPRFDVLDQAIYYELSDSGYVGDPSIQGPRQERAELLASIALVESLPSASTSGDSVTIKTLNTTRTNASGVKDRSGILRALYARLRRLRGLTHGGAAPAVADGYPDPCGACL